MEEDPLHLVAGAARLGVNTAAIGRSPIISVSDITEADDVLTFSVMVLDGREFCVRVHEAPEPDVAHPANSLHAHA